MKKNIYFLLLFGIIFSCKPKEENKQEIQITPVNEVYGLGKILPKGGISSLAAPDAGIVSEIYVTSGDHVRVNDTLMVLDNTDALMGLSEISKSYLVQQKNVENAKILLKQGNQRLKELERKFGDSRELFDAGAISREKLLELENDYELEKQTVEKLQNDVLLQNSKLNEIGAQKDIRNETLNRVTLRSPMNGVVLDVLPKKGEAVNQYETYAILAPEAPLVVIAEIDEMFSSKIKIGQRCKIMLSGNNEPVAHGKIGLISPDLKKKSLFSDSGQDFQDRRIRKIEIDLDNAPDLLIDTKVECIIELEN